jgi:hypothetical protein
MISFIAAKEHKERKKETEKPDPPFFPISLCSLRSFAAD